MRIPLKRIAHCLGALPLATIALSGCTSDSSANENEDTQLPAGVTEQYQVLAAEVAERGGSTTSGDWTVNYIVEAAEPWFEQHGHHRHAFPDAGTYTLRATLGAPGFNRHGEETEGPALAEGVTVEFPDVELGPQ
jgi:hypothetical protein